MLYPPDTIKHNSHHRARMSTNTTNEAQTNTLGSRIRSERLRLRLTQDAFSKGVGVHRRTQVNYESGVREPDTIYLESAARLGVDVAYVLTGERKDDWSQSLVHLVDVLLDLLHITKLEGEFHEIWKIAHDERVLWALLQKSPLILEAAHLSDAIERLEFVLETKSMALTAEAKADVVIRLYREAKTQGKPVDLQTVAAFIKARL
jgi:transcriptional regulator with XRE-family HTH domain